MRVYRTCRAITWASTGWRRSRCSRSSDFLMNTLGSSQQAATDPTRRIALAALLVGILAIAIGYAAAFFRTGPPAWSPWLLALGIPLSVGAIMILGAARGRRGV